MTSKQAMIDEQIAKALGLTKEEFAAASKPHQPPDRICSLLGISEEEYAKALRAQKDEGKKGLFYQ